MIHICKYFDECEEKNRLCFADDGCVFCHKSIPLYEAKKMYESALMESKKFHQSKIDGLERRLKEAETSYVKIQYQNREYTASELCKRMAELERMLNQKGD